MRRGWFDAILETNVDFSLVDRGTRDSCLLDQRRRGRRPRGSAAHSHHLRAVGASLDVAAPAWTPCRRCPAAAGVHPCSDDTLGPHWPRDTLFFIDCRANYRLAHRFAVGFKHRVAWISPAIVDRIGTR